MSLHVFGTGSEDWRYSRVPTTLKSVQKYHTGLVVLATFTMEMDKKADQTDLHHSNHWQRGY